MALKKTFLMEFVDDGTEEGIRFDRADFMRITQADDLCSALYNIQQICHQHLRGKKPMETADAMAEAIVDCIRELPTKLDELWN